MSKVNDLIPTLGSMKERDNNYMLLYDTGVCLFVEGHIYRTEDTITGEVKTLKGVWPSEKANIKDILLNLVPGEAFNC